MLDLEFLSKFGGMFVDVAYLALIGGAVGTIIALGVDRSSVLSAVTADLLHTILWFPFFIVSALPEWPIRWMPVALAGGTISVTLFVCHGLLAMRSTLQLTWRNAFLVVGRSAILHAFLYSMYYQIHHQAGWVAELSQKGVPCYAILPVLCGFLFLIDRIFGANFDQVAERDGKVLISLLKNRVRTYLLSFFLGGSICLGLWYLFHEFIAEQLLLGNVVEVLKASYALFAADSSGTFVLAGGRSWQLRDLFVSLGEIFLGLAISAGLALVAVRSLSRNSSLRWHLFRFLNMTFVAPMIVLFCMSDWLGRSLQSWLTVMGVLFLTFYPFVKVIWGCREKPRIFCVIVGAREALPLAFVAMLYGELWSASAGLGFFTVVARAQLKINEAMAVSILTLAIFLSLSLLLRVFARRYSLQVENGTG